MGREEWEIGRERGGRRREGGKQRERERERRVRGKDEVERRGGG